MLIGKVVGSVVATRKDEKLVNQKMLVVQIHDHANSPKEQYVVAVRLRPGKSKEDRALLPLLRRLIKKLKKLFKKARIRVRADSGFGKSPRLLDALDALPVEYVLAYQTLKTLKALAQPWADEAQALHDQGLVGEETQVFGEFMWQPKTGTWPCERRIVAKAEVTETFGREPRLNLRFVASKGMGRFKPRGLFGLLYWYSVLPLHGLVFRGMLRGIERAAVQIAREDLEGPMSRSPMGVPE